MSFDISVDRRTDVPRWIQLSAPIATIVAALVVGAIPLLLNGIDPVQAYAIVILQPITTPSGVSQTLIKAVPLVLAALAIYLPMKAGLWNIGAEGQIYVGGIVGTWLVLNVGVPDLLLLPLVVAGGALGGAILGLVPGWLRAKWNVNEIIVTLMLTFVAINVNDYLVRGPMQASDRAGYPASANLPGGAMLPSIPGTGVHVGIVLVVLATLGVYVLLNRTRFGYEATVLGSNPSAARGAGISSVTVFVTTMTVGGALAGIAGMAEIAGSQGRLIANFSPGYGFTAIAIALLGRSSAWHVLLAGLFFSVLFIGTGSMSVQLGASAALVEILQALLILFLITAEFVQQYELSIDRSAGGALSSAPSGETETETETETGAA